MFSDSCKPSFDTGTGRGSNPRYLYKYMCNVHTVYKYSPWNMQKKRFFVRLRLTKAYLFGRLLGTFLVANCQGKLVLWKEFLPSENGLQFQHPKYPHHSKLAILRTLYPCYIDTGSIPSIGESASKKEPALISSWISFSEKTAIGIN